MSNKILTEEHKLKIKKASTGRIYSTEAKKKMREKKNLSLKICPYCGKICDAGNAKRWHFDNCKMKIINDL